MGAAVSRPQHGPTKRHCPAVVTRPPSQTSWAPRLRAPPRVSRDTEHRHTRRTRSKGTTSHRTPGRPRRRFSRRAQAAAQWPQRGRVVGPRHCAFCDQQAQSTVIPEPIRKPPRNTSAAVTALLVWTRENDENAVLWQRRRIQTFSAIIKQTSSTCRQLVLASG